MLPLTFFYDWKYPNDHTRVSVPQGTSMSKQAFSGQHQPRFRATGSGYADININGESLPCHYEHWQKKIQVDLHLKIYGINYIA